MFWRTSCDPDVVPVPDVMSNNSECCLINHQTAVLRSPQRIHHYLTLSWLLKYLRVFHQTYCPKNKMYKLLFPVLLLWYLSLPSDSLRGYNWTELKCLTVCWSFSSVRWTFLCSSRPADLPTCWPADLVPGGSIQSDCSSICTLTLYFLKSKYVTLYTSVHRQRVLHPTHLERPSKL